MQYFRSEKGISNSIWVPLGMYQPVPAAAPPPKRTYAYVSRNRRYSSFTRRSTCWWYLLTLFAEYRIRSWPRSNWITYNALHFHTWTHLLQFMMLKSKMRMIPSLRCSSTLSSCFDMLQLLTPTFGVLCSMQDLQSFQFFLSAYSCMKFGCRKCLTFILVRKFSAIKGASSHTKSVLGISSAWTSLEGYISKIYLVDWK